MDVWQHSGVLQNQCVEIANTHLVSIRPEENQGPSKRLVLLPAGFDVQVHLRIPGQDYKEDAETGAMAALCGGYAGFLSMPNTKPVIDTVDVLKSAYAQVKAAEEKFGLKILFSAALSHSQKGEKLIDLKELMYAGAAAFTDDGFGLESDQLMEEAFRALEEIPLALLQHAEFRGHGGVLAPGPIQERLGVKPYSDEPEIRMLARDLKLLEKYPKARYHLLHTTSAKALPLLQQAREKALKVTAEVSPHHLYFSTHDIKPDNTSFKMNPPIRSPEDRLQLRQALANGGFDFVATDHAPHAANEKTDQFDLAAFGTLGLETALPVLVDMFQKGELSAERLVEVFSYAPARFMRLGESFGEFAEDHVFRAVVIDPQASTKIWQPSDFHSKSKNSCFVGAELPDCIYGHFTAAGYFAFKQGLVAEQATGHHSIM